MESRRKKARTVNHKAEFLDFVRQGDLASLQALVESSKVDNGEREELINAVDDEGWTALHSASNEGHSSVIRWLLSDSGGRAAGFNSLLTRVRLGMTALHLACENGHVECVEALVEGTKIDNGERQALFNAADMKRMTALHLACEKGHVSIISWLLSDSGGRAAGFKGLLAKTQRGEIALHLACQEGHLECVEALVEGSKIDNGEREQFINAVDNRGWTVLHYAAFYVHTSIIKWLLSDSGGRAAGFKGLLAMTENGVTALHFACLRGHLECAQALVEGSKVDNGEREALINAADNRGETALHFAALCGHVSIIRWLVSDSGGRAAGFKGVLAKTEGGATALHLTCRREQKACVQALVEGSNAENGEREVLINAADEKGWTALHHAASEVRTSIIEWLLSDSGGRAAGLKSSTVTAKTVDGESALHLAARCRNIDVLNTLLAGSTAAERMNFILCVNKHGWTVLHLAARCYREEIIRALLLHHPETQMVVNARDRRGMTALHRAVIDGIDEESRKEWVENIDKDDEIHRAILVGVLLYPGLSNDEILRLMYDEEDDNEEKKKSTRERIQAAASKIDPNLGAKFD